MIRHCIVSGPVFVAPVPPSTFFRYPKEDAEEGDDMKLLITIDRPRRIFRVKAYHWEETTELPTGAVCTGSFIEENNCLLTVFYRTAKGESRERKVDIGIPFWSKYVTIALKILWEDPPQSDE